MKIKLKMTNKNIKNYSISEVLNESLLGFIIEFYCSKKIEFILEDFSKIFDNKIIITNNNDLNNNDIILIKEYNSNKSRYKLKIDYIFYNKLNPMLNTILMWINENATLDNTTIFKIKLTFKNLKTYKQIQNMDIGKLILKINEDFIYERFGEFKNSPYAMSIKKLIPINNFIQSDNIIKKIDNTFNYPMNESFAIDFTNYTNDYLIFNYIGGPKYSEKPTKIHELIEYFILITYQSLNEPDYTISEQNELQKLTTEYLNLRKSFYNYDTFIQNYKNIKVFKDLKNDPLIIKANWHLLRDTLFKILFETNIKECLFNWDSEYGKFQIKKANLNNLIISNLDIINCKINNCFINESNFWNCKVDNSKIENSTFINLNKLDNSYMKNIRVDRENKINDCYIINEGEIINCKINNSILKNVGIGKNSKLDNCTIINDKENIKTLEKGIEVDEIRDYRWFKTLRRKDYEDKGYENEYK